MSNHGFLKMSWYWEGVKDVKKKSCGAIPTATFGNKISNFKTFATTDSIKTFSQKGLSYGSKVALLFSVENYFFLKKMELGKNATNELYSCSKWPFWQANMKIDLILVYWDARNSLFYKLVIPFKDGVTFAVTTATQSLQRCYLENVADVTYVVVTKCDFWNIFLNWNVHISDPEAMGGHRGSKRRSKARFYNTQNHPKS